VSPAWKYTTYPKKSRKFYGKAGRRGRRFLINRGEGLTLKA
jgi:hypothetical protein